MFTVTEAAAVAWEGALIPGAIVSIALFLVGCGVYAWSYVTAVRRSRREMIDLAGLFFLSGSAPKDVRWHLLGSAFAQVVIAVTAASLRPATASGILAPVYGLALCGAWASRYGTFRRRGQK